MSSLDLEILFIGSSFELCQMDTRYPYFPIIGKVMAMELRLQARDIESQL